MELESKIIDDTNWNEWYKSKEDDIGKKELGMKRMKNIIVVTMMIMMIMMINGRKN